MVPETGALFGRRMTWNIIFREGYKRFVTPYQVRIAVDHCPPISRISQIARGHGSYGDERISGNAIKRGAS